MNIDTFWQVIDDARGRVGTDDREFLRIVADHLRKKAPEEIIEFDKLLGVSRRTAYRSDLWAAAYIINGGCSDDGFEYFRMWLISCGRKAFEQAIDDPATLVDHLRMDRAWDAELEELLYLPRQIYAEMTGAEMPIRPYTPATLVGDDWSEEDVDSMFPELSEKAEARWA